MERRITRSMGLHMVQEIPPVQRRGKRLSKKMEEKFTSFPISALAHLGGLERSIREKKIEKRRPKSTKFMFSDETLQTIQIEMLPGYPQPLGSPTPPSIIYDEEEIPTTKLSPKNVTKVSPSKIPVKLFDAPEPIGDIPNQEIAATSEAPKITDFLPIQNEDGACQHLCCELPMSVLISLEQQYGMRDMSSDNIHRLTSLYCLTRSGYSLPRRVLLSIIATLLQTDDENWSSRLFCFVKIYIENHPIEMCIESRQMIIHWYDTNMCKPRTRQSSSIESWNKASNDELCIRGIFTIFLNLCEQRKNVSQCDNFLELFVYIMERCKANQLEDEGDQSNLKGFMTIDGDDRLVEMFALILKAFPAMSLRQSTLIQRVMEMVYDIHEDLVAVFNQKIRSFLRHCDWSVFVRFMESIHSEPFQVQVFRQLVKPAKLPLKEYREFTIDFFMDTFLQHADLSGPASISRHIEAHEWCSQQLREATEADYPRLQDSVKLWCGYSKALIEQVADRHFRLDLQRKCSVISKRLNALTGVVVVRE